MNVPAKGSRVWAVWGSTAGRALGFAAGAGLLAVVGTLSFSARPPSAHASAILPPDLFAETPLPMAEPPTPEPTAPAPPVRAETPTAAAADVPPVYLNEASVEDLQHLPGIGPKRARAIFDLRARIGRFRRIDDLLRVRGLGRATLKRLRPFLRIDRPVVDAGSG